MKAIRRRAADPALQWAAPGPNQQYRVAIRNEDTGERRSIYDGFRNECRLPPDLRLTPDQLSFRVEARPADEPEARFVRCQEFTAILRFGDDMTTPADDLITARAVAGARDYRLIVRDAASGEVLVDMVRPEPRFLLPAGRLRDRDCTYDLLHNAGGAWRGERGSPVTPAMIAAADARAARPVLLPRENHARVSGAAAARRPGRAEALAPHAASPGVRLMIAVEVTAHPALAPEPGPEAVERSQWWRGDGSAPVEAVAGMLEARGLKGVFLLDAFASDVMGAEAPARLAAALKRRGHGLGLFVNPAPWEVFNPALASLDVAGKVREAVARHESSVGEKPLAAAFAAGLLTERALIACRDAGVTAVFGGRDEGLRLPAWMRWRTTPFAALDDLAVIPPGMMLSTPAHSGDKVVRHPLKSTDALMASAAADALGALADEGDRLVTAWIDPMALLLRRLTRSAAMADGWNAALARHFPTWAEAGWERSPQGFHVLDGRDEIKTQMTANLVEGLARSGLAHISPEDAFAPATLRAFCQAGATVEPLLEHRRGPRLTRRSAIRRYDEAFRLALRAEAG